MGWNEPGGSDPWGGGGNRGGGDQGPPDLDEVVRKLQNRFGGLFGGGRGGQGGGGGAALGGLSLLLVVGLVVWAASGIYIVDPAERGVVLRFGKYTETTEPGPHWHLPYPIESVSKVNVDRVQSIELGFKSAGRTESSVLNESLMLTQDENIVDVRLAVQYRIKDARDYLFELRAPDDTLRQAAESAVREVVGKNKMDFVITEGRSEIAARTKELMQEILDRYKSGLVVTTVNLADAQAPDEVQEAFADAIKAREDEQRFKNEAEAYANEIIPKARGAAARQLEEARAYKESVTAKAEGEADRFSKLLAEYHKAPQVTRERLYLDSVEKVFSNTSKVVVDVKGNNLLYLPLDKGSPQRDAEAAARAAASAAASAVSRGGASTPNPAPVTRPAPRRLRDDLRMRETR
ncbi:FtsH protease activity modulator HflK [Endothiovibrio diazotrophicus]